MDFFGECTLSGGQFGSWLLGWIFFAPSGTSDAEINEDDPVTTLKIRFAKGEISKEEYEQSRNLLRSDK